MVSFLMVKTRDGGSVAGPMTAYKYTNGVMEQIGDNSFGSIMNNANCLPPHTNNIVQWNGSLWFDGDANHNIFQLNYPAGSGVWDVAANYGSLITSASIRFKTGLYPIDIAGTSYLLGGFVTNRTTTQRKLRFFKIDKDGNITYSQEHQVLSQGSQQYLDDTTTGIGFRNVMCYDKKLIFYISENNSFEEPVILVYDFVSDTLTEHDMTSFSNNSDPIGMTMLNDTLYVLAALNDTFWHLLKDEGGLIDLGVMSTDNPVNAGPDNSFQPCLFNDGTDLFAVFRGNDNGETWKMNQVTLTSSGTMATVTDITSVLPSGMTNAINADPGDRVHKYVDFESNPGGPPDFYFWHLREPNGTVNKASALYKWPAGGSGNWQFVATGPDSREYCYPDDEFGGGHRVWSASGEMDSIAKVVAIGSGIDIAVTIKGTATSGTIKCQLYYENGTSKPSGLCTLTEVVSGAGTLNGNTVEGLHIGDNVTRVRWDALNDGIVDGDTPRIVPRTFT